jgi:anti-sigma28 factor (negative regulator of flagellin synthesis)
MAVSTHTLLGKSTDHNPHLDPMSPPPLPLASPGGTIPASMSQHAHAAPLSPSFVGNIPSFDAAGIPIRHPRPLTAAELHLELEKEQEAVVNRLTRELSALRAHSASVASTASSVTSGVHVDHDIVGSTHPTSARRHRSSSSVSRTSASAPYGNPLNPATASIPHHRYSVSSQNAPSDPSAAQQARSASVVSTPRYEEVAHYRQELEEAKRENEVLKKRIRELERAIRGGDAADTQRGRTGAPTSAVTASGTTATSATAEVAS